MNLEWILLLAFSFGLGTIACGLIVAAYKWGRFTALSALQGGFPKWKAYLAALSTPLILAVFFGIGTDIVSGELIFCWMAIPATIGTLTRYQVGVN